MHRKKAGYSLIEIAVVLIIIGVLIAIAIVEYGDLGERSRMSEAKEAIGAIRKAQALYFQDFNEFAQDITYLEKTFLKSDIPAECSDTHWFRYALATGDPSAYCEAGWTGPCFMIRASRCTMNAGGKNPDSKAGYSLTFQEDFVGNQKRCLIYDSKPKCISW